MSSTLFCGNLSFDVADSHLQTHLNSLAVAGVVCANVSMRGDRSKGWGLIEFNNAEQAAAAIPLLDNTVLEGRPLRVRESRTEGSTATAPAARATNNSSNNVSNNSPGEPSPRLFVGNLPWEATDDQLSALFKGHSPVSAKIAMRQSGKSRGFAIVEFKTTEEAQKALTAVNNSALGGRTLAVRFDRQPEPITPTSRVFVGNLPWSVADEDLAGMFSGLSVKSASVKSINGRSRGYGIVEFSSLDEANKALATKSEFEYGGRNVFARFDREV